MVASKESVVLRNMHAAICFQAGFDFLMEQIQYKFVHICSVEVVSYVSFIIIYFAMLDS